MVYNMFDSRREAYVAPLVAMRFSVIIFVDAKRGPPLNLYLILRAG